MPLAAQVQAHLAATVTGVAAAPRALEARLNARAQVVLRAPRVYAVPRPVQDSGASPGAVMSIPAKAAVTLASLPPAAA